jgi:hypothetical protein
MKLYLISEATETIPMRLSSHLHGVSNDQATHFVENGVLFEWTHKPTKGWHFYPTQIKEYEILHLCELTYSQMDVEPDKWIEHFGTKELVRGSKIIEYEGNGELVLSSKVDERIKELKSYTNVKYTNFKIKEIK